MTKREARRRIWERLASTARNDLSLGDWLYEEAGSDADVDRLKEASEEVARSIERCHLKEQ